MGNGINIYLQMHQFNKAFPITYHQHFHTHKGSHPNDKLKVYRENRYSIKKY